MKTFNFTLLTAFTALLFGTSSCFDEIFIEGNGKPLTEVRQATGFNEVASSGDFRVTVLPGNEYSLEVTAESNLLPYIKTDVVGHTLKIRTQGIHSLRQNIPIEVNITTPDLSGLEISGSGWIKTGSFESTNFKISISGSGDVDTKINTGNIKANVSGSGTIYLEGIGDNSEYVISGSGKIKSYNFEQNNCQAVISGSGDIYVNASETIEATISGSGRIYYVNNPTIHSKISGSGSVVDKN